jgi:subtilase family serine protease
MHRHIRSFCVALALVAALAAVLAAAATAAPASRARLTGSVPKWATPAAFKAAAAPGQTLGFQVYLGWRNDAGAKALARAVSDPASRFYGRYLSPAKFRRLFAPREADVAAVRSWLRSQGFAIAGIPANNLYVPATGTVAQAQKAFGVRLNQYTVDGQTLRAPASALTIPASLSSIVTAVVGLDQSKAHPKAIADNAPPPAGYRNAQPWSTFWGQKIATDQPKAFGRYQPYAPRGYTPSQFRGAYGVAKAVSHGNDGSGVTVAIIDAYAARPSSTTSIGTRTTTVCRSLSAGSSDRSSTPAWPLSCRRPTSPAGTAKRPSTSRPCTAWRPGRRSSSSGP